MSTSSLWMDMLGIGPLMAQVNDPGFQETLKQFASAQFETRDRLRRVEAMLIQLTEGYENGGFIALPAPVPAGNGAARAGAFAATGGALDDGVKPGSQRVGQPETRRRVAV